MRRLHVCESGHASLFPSYHLFTLSFAAALLMLSSRRPIVSVSIRVCLIMNHGTILQQNCRELAREMSLPFPFMFV